jgi:hypothetical protein
LYMKNVPRNTKMTLKFKQQTKDSVLQNHIRPEMCTSAGWAALFNRPNSIC